MTMTKREKAEQLRNETAEHINCAQSVLMTFAEEAGVSEAQAKALCAHFGSGMRMGATCGAVTGGLMVLGLMGKDDKAARAFVDGFREAEGELACAQLVKLGREKGLDRKTCCDALVFRAVELLEKAGQ